MKITRPCYAIVALSETPQGDSRPLVMESYLDTEMYVLAKRADELKERHGYTDAWVIELPIRVQTKVMRVAGEAGKVVHGNGIDALRF